MWRIQHYHLIARIVWYFLGIILLAGYAFLAYFCLDNYLETLSIRTLVLVFGVGKFSGGFLLSILPEMILATPQAMAILFQQRMPIVLWWQYKGMVKGWLTAVSVSITRLLHTHQHRTKHLNSLVYAPPYPDFATPKTPYAHYGLSCCLLE